MDHHRAEVGDVGDDLPGALHGHALVGPGFGVRGRERSTSSGSVGETIVRLVKVESESRRPGPHLGLLAEQDQVGDPAAQQDRGSLEDPVVLALRQHDALADPRGPAP